MRCVKSARARRNRLIGEPMRVSFGTTTANAFGNRFLRHLGVEAKAAVSNPHAVLRNSRDAAQRLFDARRGSLPDKQAQMIVGVCSLVLAAYRELGAGGLDSKAAFEIARRGFYRTYQTPTKLMTRAMLALSRDPVKALSRRSLKAMSERMYGATMEFGQEVTHDTVDLIVNRCAFHQFFVDNGEPQLTPIFCGWDRNWMDVIDASNRPVRTERPTTISTGADRCRFRLVRDDSGRPKRPKDVILDLAAAPPSSSGTTTS